MIEALYLFQGQTVGENSEPIEGYYQYNTDNGKHYIVSKYYLVNIEVIPTSVYLIKQPQ